MLRDDLRLATPPPHPSEIPAANPNALATTPTPPTAGVKLSLSIVNPRQISTHLNKLSQFNSTKSNLGTYSIEESDRESRTSHDTGSDSTKAPAFGEDNLLLSPNSNKEGLKRRKPKTNIVKSNSSFISRVIPHESINKRLQEHDPDGLFIFANINRAFQWLDLSSTTFSKVDNYLYKARS